MGKVVLLNLESEDGELSIQVTDYGIGILPQDQKYVFDPFFRGKNVEKIQGTGYGLSILKGCVETLKGSIFLDSTPGKGSTFKIRIPI
jgi:signal transduction histidine kinase